MSEFRALLKRFGPALGRVPPGERLRAGAGAALGLLVVAFGTLLALGPSAGIPLIIAPMGASAVLLFAVPASPLAQPWSMLAGNIVSAVIGVTAAQWIPDPLVAAGVAGGTAIAAMASLRCLHPPSGAVALTAVLGGPAVAAAGYGFVLWPVALNSLLLIGTAMVFNNLTGKSYPHRPIVAVEGPRADPPPAARLGVGAEDVEAVLKDYGEVLDVAPGDLAGLLREAQLRGLRRRSAHLDAADIMSRDVIAVTRATPLREAVRLMREQHVRALPVTDAGMKLAGIITQSDIINHTVPDAHEVHPGWRERLRHLLRPGSVPGTAVGDIMTVSVLSARQDSPVVDLVPPMADRKVHLLPVVDADSRVVGVVSQSDLIAALFDERLIEAAGERG
ncbi:HPP family protein [Ancylobacter terrae]|uniref:HPP family protein n=1 Tax=Ancylobacter sp. sgz301288 TaxID=3342077 RepID=UPI00385E6291